VLEPLEARNGIAQIVRRMMIKYSKDQSSGGK
jgi:hypothetical protein